MAVNGVLFLGFCHFNSEGTCSPRVAYRDEDFCWLGLRIVEGW